MTRRTMYSRVLLLALSLLAAGQFRLSAQVSNSNLNGAYYVRQTAIDDNNFAYSAQGSITFNGSGGFTFNGTEIDTARSATTSRTLTVNGSYSVLSNGIISLTSLIDTTDTVYGGYANNIVVASPTESGYYGVMVIIPAGTTSSNSTFNGNYQFVSLDYVNGNYNSVRNASFTATANGQGSLGNLSLTGQAANLSGTSQSQSISGATYTVSGNGSGTLTLPTSADPSTLLVSGNKTLYVSADGNVVLGGSANGYDMIIGVKALSSSASASTFQGAYYIAGEYLDNTEGDIVNSSVLVGYAGSINANGQGSYIYDYRTNPQGYPIFDDTESSPNGTPNASGVLAKTYYTYFFGADGIILGTGGNNNYELDVAVQIPAFTGSGVFLNPIGVLNAASFAPITNPIAPGELLTLFGTGLSSQSVTASALPFPNTLGGVTVTINGTPAPIYYVSPNQISVVAPYSSPTDGSLVSVQVNNNGTLSNTVQTYSSPTAPGIFSQSQNGIGTGAILRQNSSIATSSNPATRGETIQIFLTGLGAVSPATAAGAAGPSSPLSTITGDLAVYIDGIQAAVSYAGLAPGLAGLYQINAVIPSGVSSGNVYVDIETDDAYHSQVTVPVQ